jgi:cation diffusion facilitator CzcD-associated flavoprotein CzcO
MSFHYGVLTNVLDPGCAVDIPAVLYSLSFAPNHDFSRLFPRQEEIMRHFDQTARRFGISSHVSCGKEWTGARWQASTSTWLVTLRDVSTGQVLEHECQVLISAVGGLVDPNPFQMEGMDTFEGDIIHTARWKRDVFLRDKNVVVIGNGGMLAICLSTIFPADQLLASASQLIPAIVDEVNTVTQFIRV